MKKKIVFIGIGLLVAALILFLLSGFLLTNGLGSSTKLVNLTVKADNFAVVNIAFSGNTSALAVYAISESPINLYVLNNSALSEFEAYITANRNASGISYIHNLNVNSSYIFTNSMLSIVPISVGSASTRSVFPGNRVNVVLDNTFGSKSVSNTINASVSYLPLRSSRLIASAALGYAVLILGIVGIILIVYGLVKKDESKSGPQGAGGGKASKAQQDKEYVDRLYKGVKGSKGAKGKSGE